MSEEGDTSWVSLAEKFFGVILIIVGAIMLYFSATTNALGPFDYLFGALSLILLVIGFVLLLVKPPE